MMVNDFENKSDIEQTILTLLSPNEKQFERKKTVQFTLPRSKKQQPCSLPTDPTDNKSF